MTRDRLEAECLDNVSDGEMELEIIDPVTVQLVARTQPADNWRPHVRIGPPDGFQLGGEPLTGEPDRERIDLLYLEIQGRGDGYRDGKRAFYPKMVRAQPGPNVHRYGNGRRLTLGRAEGEAKRA